MNQVPRNQVIAPTGIAPPAARYAHAVLSENPSRWLHTAGVVGVRPDGTIPNDVGDQAQVIWQNLDAMLSEAKMSAADIVTMMTYVIPEQDLASVMEARDAYFGDHLAASTLLVVPQLAQPSWKVEISIIASK